MCVSVSISVFIVFLIVKKNKRKKDIKNSFSIPTLIQLSAYALLFDNYGEVLKLKLQLLNIIFITIID